MYEHEGNATDRLSEMLWKWEESVIDGNPVSAEELCRDCPHLIANLNREIRRLQSFDRFMLAGQTNNDSAEIAPISIESGRFPQVPGFELLEQIGRGGMGVVYKARQEKLGRVVAIKTLAGSQWAQPDFVDRLRREAKVLSLLNHPHVVQVFDIIETRDAVSLVLEYVQGDNLAARIQQNPMTSTVAARYSFTLARTISVVHHHGLLHRDIKPANILICVNGDIKVADFGLAKQIGMDEELTITGELFGSPSYMAPEQANGTHKAVDARADIYAIGATLYHMLTGRPPFVGVSTVDTLDQVRKCEPVRPRLLNAGASIDLETICLKCLEKEPSRRFASAAELSEELERFLHGSPIRSRPVGVANRFWRWCRRKPASAAIIGLSLVLIGIIVNYNIAHQRNLVTYNRNVSRLNDDLRNAAAATQQMLQEAKESDRKARDLLYAAEISRAVADWRTEDTREMTEILDRQIPKDGESDRRGFEWYYLRRQAGLAKRVLVPGGPAVYTLGYSPSRLQLAVAGVGAIVKFINPETGDIFKEIPTGQIEVNAIAFAPNQSEFATAGDDGTVKVFSLVTGNERLRIETPIKKVFQVVFTPDAKRIVACGVHKSIYIFDATSGEVIAMLEGHDSTVETLLLADDGKTLVSAANDNTIRFWNVETGKQLSSLASNAAVENLVLSRSPSLLVTGDTKGQVRTIGLTQNREVGNVKNQDRICSLALHPGGSLLAIGDASGKIRLRRIDPSGALLEDDFQPWQAHRGNVNSLIWSPNAARLISAGKDGSIFSWDHLNAPRTEPKRFFIEQSRFHWTIKHTSTLSLVEWSAGLPSRNDYKQAEISGRLVRWNLKSGSPLSYSARNRFTVAHESADGKYLATTSKDNENYSFEVFRVPDNAETPLDQIPLGNADGLAGKIVFLPESQTLCLTQMWERVTHAAKPIIPVFQLPSFQRQDIMLPSNATVKERVLLPKTRRAAFLTQHDLHLWNPDDHSPLWSVPFESPFRLMVSPDERLIAASTANRIVTVFDATNGRQLFQNANLAEAVDWMVFSEDSRTLVTVAIDGTIRFTHVATGQVLIEFPKVGDIRGVEFLDPQHLVCYLRTYADGIRYDPSEIVVFDASKPDDEESTDNK